MLRRGLCRGVMTVRSANPPIAIAPLCESDRRAGATAGTAGGQTGCLRYGANRLAGLVFAGIADLAALVETP